MPNITIRRGQLRWLWVAAMMLVVDFSTKILALTNLDYQKPVAIFPFLNMNLAFNRGAAFSFLASESGWQLWFFSIIAIIVSVVILILLSKLYRNENIKAISLCLILSGAIGNVLDRINYGYVIDFIDLHYNSYHWPTFNIADTSICVGAFLFILSSLFCYKKEK
ncbi:signal peptidase II [Thiotrichales bacterium 19S9-12]|nr:signal peptidase II [Thiotrichales bacterium 19S9-11]MCF6811085.1 signal peptidase II [Thiotrichales bacterium 19S9-12]